MAVATRLYRLRMLNACNARTLLLAFRTAGGTRVPFLLIGSDGGLLASPQRCEQAFFAAAERLDILLDLRAMPVGETVVLESLAFDAMHANVAPASRQGPEPVQPQHEHASTASATVAPRTASWPEGAPRPLLQFRVGERIDYTRRVPERLSAIEPIDVAGARERPLRLGFNKGRWRINDRVFAMGETPIEVARDSTEVWLLRNYYTSMPHAMHLHGFQFEVRRARDVARFRFVAEDRRPGTSRDRSRLQGHRARVARRKRSPRDSLRTTLSGRADLHVPLPQPRARGCRDDARRQGRVTGDRSAAVPPLESGDFSAGVARSIRPVGGCMDVESASGEAFSGGVARSMRAVGGCFFAFLLARSSLAPC
jgi:FtsP/CotA-like multicopper oxidase with cupredoxin domain